MVYAHSVEIRMTTVISVIVLGTWLETVLVIAAMLEQHHPVAGNAFTQGYMVVSVGIILK